MQMRDLENILRKEGMLTVKENGVTKRFVKDTKIQSGDNITDAFGIYYNNNNEFCVFFTEHERGRVTYTRRFEVESEACSCLYDRLRDLKMEEHAHKRKKIKYDRRMR